MSVIAHMETIATYAVKIIGGIEIGKISNFLGFSLSLEGYRRLFEVSCRAKS